MIQNSLLKKLLFVKLHLVTCYRSTAEIVCQIISDQVAVPDYPSGATEHWGLITYRQTNLLYDENSVAPSGKERVALVVGHELAHNVSFH